MALALWIWLTQTTTFSTWLVVGGGFLVGGLVYSASISIYRPPEIQAVLQAIRGRFKKSA
jgi:hypothetical protein